MAKHHHQSKEEQIYNKTHGAVPFHREKMTNQASKLTESGHNQRKITVNDQQAALIFSNVEKR
jgi:hypothetical protein